MSRVLLAALLLGGCFGARRGAGGAGGGGVFSGSTTYGLDYRMTVVAVSARSLKPPSTT